MEKRSLSIGGHPQQSRSPIPGTASPGEKLQDGLSPAQGRLWLWHCTWAHCWDKHFSLRLSIPGAFWPCLGAELRRGSVCVCVCVAVPPREALGARHSGQCHLLLRAWKQPRLPPARGTAGTRSVCRPRRSAPPGKVCHHRRGSGECAPWRGRLQWKPLSGSPGVGQLIPV